MCLSGIKNADENELRSIASDPDQTHMYNVKDFKFLVDIVEDVTSNLCNSVKGPGTLLGLGETLPRATPPPAPPALHRRRSGAALGPGDL